MKFEHNNISPLDSRYAEKIVPIREAFSEKALIKTRFNIEIDWLLFLCNKMPNDFPKLSKISINKILKFIDFIALRSFNIASNFLINGK